MFSKNLKYIFLASLLIALIYPLANIFFVFPAFSELSIDNAEKNAVRIGRFLAETIVADDKKKLTNIDEIERAAKTFNLYKIKLYSSSGVTLYSTDPADISEENTEPYFREIVAEGQIYTKFVVKDSMSAEGVKVAYDVVETYVPIMEASTFLGAFEIYQNVTERNVALRQIASQFAIFSIVIMAIFLLIMVLMLLRTDKDLLITDRQLPISRLQAPFALLLFMAVSLFIAESLVMTLLSLWNIPSPLMETLVDSSLLVILAAPMIYFFVNRPLLVHIAQSRKDQELIAQHYHTEQIMRQILLLSITNLSLKEVLEEFIQLITSFPWLEVESKGAVFLVGDKPDTLDLMAHHNLNEALLSKCALVPFGTCLCGKAALTGKTVFSPCLDEEHHIRYEGIEPHGHYCVPFYSSAHELLGVFTLYTMAGAVRNPEAEETLTAASHLLAGVVERKKLEEKLQQISITDELTGLLNRRGFMVQAVKCLKVAGRNSNKSMLLFADMDNLKGINDDLGHQLGDEALKKTGDILKNTFRDTDIVGRMGGDEFAVLFTTNVATHHYSTMLSRIEDRIAEWNKREDRKFDLSLSIGLVEHNPENPRTLEEMLADADARMYKAKQKKKN
ncbi:MAG: sensor domain-containing diguanylate cyclase [Desulfurivibrionaceae bacterium]